MGLQAKGARYWTSGEFTFDKKIPTAGKLLAPRRNAPLQNRLFSEG